MGSISTSIWNIRDLLKVRLITSKNLLRLAEKLMIKTYQLEFHMNKNYIRACILFVNLFQKLHQSQITLSRLSKLQGFQKWRCSKIYNLTVKFFLVPPYLVLLALQHLNYQRLLTSSEMLVFFFNFAKTSISDPGERFSSIK